MYGNRKKNTKRNNSKSVRDVTINDFANTTDCKNRLKNPPVSVASARKQLDERAWDEKTETFDEDFDFVRETNEDGTISVVIKKKNGPRRQKKTRIHTSSRTGVDYHIDIWFLISEYIKPETVGKFAAICKTSYSVVQSAKFWFMMYRRYYKYVPNLPERLQPEYMVRFYGLRCCVIRVLHHFYKPFVMRRVTSDSPSLVLKKTWRALKNLPCISMWHRTLKQKSTNVWLYYFKFRDNVSFINRHRHKPSRKADLIERLGDICANSEEYCSILEVTLPEFVSIPLVMGHTLSRVSLITSCTCTHQLILELKDAGGITSIVFNPVVHVNVLDWWHPLYPHQLTTPVLNPE